VIEDVIVYKLMAGRARDIADIQSIVEAVSVHEEYLERWARVWEVDERWAALRGTPRTE
jgi:hypothetical protein